MMILFLGDFEVSVLQGISIRSRDDIQDIWKDVKKRTKVVLWCDGLRVKRKRKAQNEDGEEDNKDDVECESRTKRSKKDEEREDVVMNTLKELKEKHGNAYSPMQFRIWSNWKSAFKCR